MSRIDSFVKDIEQVVEMGGVRVLAPIKNTSLIGFEIPKKDRTFPTTIPKNKDFELAMGEDVNGEVKYFDIRKAPHMLVAGTSGSGKSVFLNSLIKQLLTIPNVELHLFDPKKVELNEFEGHKKVVEYSDKHKDIPTLLYNLTKEMDKRYEYLKEHKVKSIQNAPKMKYKFVIIDEYADLTMKSEVNHHVQVLSQKGRACGIHLIIATQRASTKIMGGDLKINFPCKVVFKMSKAVDSRVMMDEDGAEKLLGRGDMLFSFDGNIERLQGYNLTN
jgi:S-DNA-T family DNA segregation ATPase FtsK/SpoIIIE